MVRLAAVVVISACAGKPAEAPPADAIKHVATLDLAKHDLTTWVGLPMSGTVDVDIYLQHGKDDLRKAVGTVRVTCAKGCRLGDDRTKLKPRTAHARSSAFVGDGVDFGHIDFASFHIVLAFANGRATITTWDVRSPDIELLLSGSMALGKTLADSTLDMCLRFDAKPGLADRDPKLHAIINTTGAVRSSTDNLFNIQVRDRVTQPKLLPRVCDGSPPPPHSEPALVVPDPPAPLDDAALDAVIRTAVTRTSATTFDIDAAAWQQLSAHPMGLAKGARIVPAVKDGQPIGFKIFAIRPGALHAKLGLQNGDTLQTIAGMPLTTPDKALEAYTRVRDTKKGESVSLTLERQGQPLTLTYTLR